jgi:hypothetical protein
MTNSLAGPSPLPQPRLNNPPSFSPEMTGYSTPRSSAISVSDAPPLTSWRIVSRCSSLRRLLRPRCSRGRRALEMLRIHAPPVVTCVVDVVSRRNGPDQLLVHVAVSPLGRTPSSPVPAALAGGAPDPAARLGVDVVPEPHLSPRPAHAAEATTCGHLPRRQGSFYSVRRHSSGGRGRVRRLPGVGLRCFGRTALRPTIDESTIPTVGRYAYCADLPALPEHVAAGCCQ